LHAPGAEAASRLGRWHAAAPGARSIACIGDSITEVRSARVAQVESNWVEQLTVALQGDRPAPGGFRGLWCDDEWRWSGGWRRTTVKDAFDVAPFGHGWCSTGQSMATMTWTKPPAMTVDAFDIYWAPPEGASAWEFRVDGGAWQRMAGTSDATAGALRRTAVAVPVVEYVEVRAGDSGRPSAVAIVGIGVHAHAAATGTLVHNLGAARQLVATFCRDSAGDPLAVLDELQPQLAIVCFSNDVLVRKVDVYARALQRLIERVQPYADVLLIVPFEQRAPRRIEGAVTVEGSNSLRAVEGVFLDNDNGAPLRGEAIAPGARIAHVDAFDAVTMTLPATSSHDDGVLMVDGVRTAHAQALYRAFTKAVAERFGCAVLDLYEAWSSSYGAGWRNAYASGVMFDGLHPSQRGHDDIARRVEAMVQHEPRVAEELSQ
jgi:hypothetical protein